MVLKKCFVSHRNIGYISFPLLWKYGYHHAKWGQKAMACTAMQSQDVFIIMAAEISYLLVVTENLTDTGKSWFSWWSIVLTEHIGGNWLDLIRSSWIIQQDVGLCKGNKCQMLQVGMFVDVHTCNFVHFLHAYDW